MSRADKWMPLYVGDYLRDTGHLTTTEHGAYLLLIMHAWSHEGVLPADSERLRSITKMDPEPWGRSEATLLEFFQLEGAVYRHGRVTQELGNAVTVVTQRRAAGKASAAARWGTRQASIPLENAQHNNGRYPTVTDPVTASVEVTLKQNHTQPQPHKEEERITPLPLLGDRSSDAQFDVFWSAYPRKDDKGHARKAWATAVRKADPQAIIAGTRRYTFSPDRKFQPLPATWLNGERWADQTAGTAQAQPERTAANPRGALITPMSGAL